MFSPFQNILIVGATGSVGSIAFQALLKEPYLTVTALQRSSSKNKLLSNVNVITINDSYSLHALVDTFKPANLTSGDKAPGS
ncbi:hypothetical protein QQZ08_006878 [Neonectria magnoliae]|uniref:NAD-dependent epimerase/dehydratase domain-containing protein n=1 Tax=Neonectria magnoliae TaxID=2732573 RepID=A0ABR1HZN5_9HYPO